MTPYRVPLAVVVCTLNEEVHIQRCLSGVSWADELFVVDAMSTDGTSKIAVRCGAVVVRRPWPGYSAQKNWALENLPILNEWILFLDADETPSDALRQSIERVVGQNGPEVGYFVNRAVTFFGRPLRHAYHYPDPTLRLLRRGRGRFDDRRAHERLVADGPTASLTGDLLHENVKSLSDFFDRHNRYSSLEAEDRMDIISGHLADTLRAAFRGDPGQRRRALKNLWIRFPLFTRPWLRFVHIYVWRRGFRDGLPGLIYALLIGAYELHIDAKTYELRRRMN